MKVRQLKEQIKNHNFKVSATRKTALKLALLDHWKEYHSWIEREDEEADRAMVDLDDDDSPGFVSEVVMDLNSDCDAAQGKPREVSSDLEEESTSSGVID